MAISLPDLDANLPADRFLDRELSWLAFNKRVLELAEDPNLYLLERVNFLSIFASNLDEFFMVRVAGLKRRIATGLATTSASGLEPAEVLARISEDAHALQRRHAETFTKVIEPALAEKGIRLVRWNDLSEAEKAEALVNTSVEGLKSVQAQLGVADAQVKSAQANVAQRDAALATGGPGAGKVRFLAHGWTQALGSVESAAVTTGSTSARPNPILAKSSATSEHSPWLHSPRTARRKRRPRIPSLSSSPGASPCCK